MHHDTSHASATRGPGTTSSYGCWKAISAAAFDTANIIASNPLATCGSIVRFSQPSKEPDLPRLERLIDTADLVVPNSETMFDFVARTGISERRDIMAFRYFDPKHFAALEGQLARELSLLGYSPRYAMASGSRERWRLCLPGLSWLRKRG